MGEARRRKLLDPDYGKPKPKEQKTSQADFIIKRSSIASFLQYFIEAMHMEDVDNKHCQNTVYRSLKDRANVMRGIGGIDISIKEVLEGYGNEEECSIAFLSLGLSAICDGLFSYIKRRIPSIKNIEEVIKSFDPSDVERVTLNLDKYQKQQEQWLEAFAAM